MTLTQGTIEGTTIATNSELTVASDTQTKDLISSYKYLTTYDVLTSVPNIDGNAYVNKSVMTIDDDTIITGNTFLDFMENAGRDINFGIFQQGLKNSKNYF